jgi:hypothetical protein
MAQNALTVTNPNPSPPTNMSFTGTSAPNPPNYTKTQYANVFNMSALNTGAGGTMVYTDGRPVQTIPGVGVNQTPAPYDAVKAVTIAPSGPQWTGTVTPVLPAAAANIAALASGTGATSGGTEGTFPGTDSAPFDTPNMVGPVPASTSVAHEAAGSVIVTQKVAGATANDYNPATFLPYIGAGAPTATGVTGPWQMVTCSTGPTLTANTMPQPNQLHASSLAGATNPALTTITPTTAVSGSGTTALTAVTGTNFTPQSVVYANGVAIPTVYVSATTLTATMPKKATAGTWPITVVTGGVVTTTAQTFTWT